LVSFLTKFVARETVSCSYHFRSEMTLIPAGCHGNLPVLNLLSASVAKNQHFRHCRKTIRWIEKWCELLEWARRSQSPCKVCGDRTTRAGCRCENVVFFVCHAWSACKWGT